MVAAVVVDFLRLLKGVIILVHAAVVVHLRVEFSAKSLCQGMFVRVGIIAALVVVLGLISSIVLLPRRFLDRVRVSVRDMAQMLILVPGRSSSGHTRAVFHVGLVLMVADLVAVVVLTWVGLSSGVHRHV